MSTAKKKPTAKQKAEARKKMQKAYNRKKKAHDAENRRRKQRGKKQIDWPYEDLADFASRVGHLVLDIGEWGFGLIEDLFDSAFGCDSETSELGSGPDGEEACLKKCPAGTVPTGTFSADGTTRYCMKPIKNRKRAKKKNGASDCVARGGFPTTNGRGQKLCVFCPEGEAFSGFNANDDPICSPQKQTPVTTTAGQEGKMTFGDCRSEGGTPVFSEKKGKAICVICAKEGEVFSGFDANGDPQCDPPEAPSTQPSTPKDASPQEDASPRRGKSGCKGGKFFKNPSTGKRKCFKCPDGSPPLGVSKDGKVACPSPRPKKGESKKDYLERRKREYYNRRKGSGAFETDLNKARKKAEEAREAREAKEIVSTKRTGSSPSPSSKEAYRQQFIRTFLHEV